ncbi:hypothetical protein DPMN_030282 [Dreissena polymorpha]|uniref:Uncharacterized protein n=1 Tax=Dreissena polymorpha TaxID=45954 RepID=A0A9D4LXW6_DREPO|nr:hypothetical protein DPMN_030282 [Dreissena polymorpha]
MKDKYSERAEMDKRCTSTGTSPSCNEVVLRPSEIRFSQFSVSRTFTDGTPIEDLLKDIVAGRCFASSVKPIEVASVNGTWYSNDNRRLWVFQELERLGRLTKTRVKVVKRVQPTKFTTMNKGISVSIRGGNADSKVFQSDTCTSKSGKKKRPSSSPTCEIGSDKGVDIVADVTKITATFVAIDSSNKSGYQPKKAVKKESIQSKQFPGASRQNHTNKNTKQAKKDEMKMSKQSKHSSDHSSKKTKCVKSKISPEVLDKVENPSLSRKRKTKTKTTKAVCVKDSAKPACTRLEQEVTNTANNVTSDAAVWDPLDDIAASLCDPSRRDSSFMGKCLRLRYNLWESLA